MGKRPKFFCENCGAEVKLNTRICQHCGSFFANIKCPSCGFIGVSDDFLEGCPKCGYAIESTSNEKKHSPKFSKNKNKNTSNDDNLPIWVYLIVGILLFSFIALIFR